MRTIGVCALGLLAVPAASWGQVINPANGHTYQLTPAATTWAGAQAAAAGAGGYLATFTTPSEWQWAMANVPFEGQFAVWLGGRDGGTGSWAWASGEPFTFAVWFGVPPVGPAERFVGLTTDGSERGSWFGASATGPLRGLIEIGAACYANCDGSSGAPVLNVADFTCFLQRYAAGDFYANCDGSTEGPVLNVSDFTCFLQKYAAGCSVP